MPAMILSRGLSSWSLQGYSTVYEHNARPTAKALPKLDHAIRQ